MAWYVLDNETDAPLSAPHGSHGSAEYAAQEWEAGGVDTACAFLANDDADELAWYDLSGLSGSDVEILEGLVDAGYEPENVCAWVADGGDYGAHDVPEAELSFWLSHNRAADVDADAYFDRCRD